MLAEFRGFLTKTNALALAVGVVIGAAIGKVVSSLVDDILMPVIGLVLPGGDWRAAKIPLRGDAAISYGQFFGNVLDFIIVAFVVFLILRSLLKPVPEPAAAEMKSCPECLEMIPAAARRCRACAQLA
ncbi:MAG TPA: large conductance mechanosensitive channel protein MscL [Thermoanaerobaculia bacterium]|nr:large conductance mechanosensitive channel protein MscL [Thermoanaerobaculia bacterium]